MSPCDTEPISDLPPSAKLVYKILEYNGELTQKQIANKSRLSPRTTRDALTKLESADIVEYSINLADARQRLYHLTETHAVDTE